MKTTPSLILAALALSGCNVPPMNEAQRANYDRAMANMYQQQQLQAAQPIYQPVQVQPLQLQAPNLQRYAPIETTCLRNGTRTTCTTYP